MRAFAALFLLSAPVGAQGDWLLDPMVIEQCLATGLVEGCIGMVAQRCEQAEGAMACGLCLGAETAFWQGRADAALARLALREADVQALSSRRGVDPVPALAAIEASFAAYRDAACAWREGQWDGIHHGWEWADCRLRLTARHALMLHETVEALP